MSRLRIAAGVSVGILATLVLFQAADLPAPATAAPQSCEDRPGRGQKTAAEIRVVKVLDELFRQCSPANALDNPRWACNVFLGRALGLLFKNTDFKTGRDSFMLANDIANGLSQPGNAGWRKIGTATDQKALDTAQELANQGRPVIAARSGYLQANPTPGAALRGPGHVVLIIPGNTEKYHHSTQHSWKELKTPNSASFFLDQPNRYYIGCPLSTAWRTPDGEIGLYTKP